MNAPSYLPTIAELEAEEQQLADEIRRDSDPRCVVCLGVHSWFFCPIDDTGAYLAQPLTASYRRTAELPPGTINITKTP